MTARLEQKGKLFIIQKYGYSSEKEKTYLRNFRFASSLAKYNSIL